jgi:hypothetical protein
MSGDRGISGGFYNITPDCLQHDLGKKDKYIFLKRIRAEWNLAKPMIVGNVVGIGLLMTGLKGMEKLTEDILNNWNIYSHLDKFMGPYGIATMGLLALAGLLTWREGRKQAAEYANKKDFNETTLRWMRAGKHTAWGAFYIYSLNLACSLVSQAPSIPQENARFIGTISSGAAF